MSTNTRITRSKGESDGLSLPMRTRPTRKETISGKDRGTALNTTSNAGLDQHQQTPTQMPQLLTQLPQANPVRRMETSAPMLPSGPHRPLTPCMPLPASPTSGSQPSQLSAPLFKCHDLKEILWVPNFLLYLSNMLSMVGVKELRYYS